MEKEESRTRTSKIQVRTLKEHFCEIILKLVYWSMKRCHLKVFLLLVVMAILFSRAEQF